ncbi:MAG TPA: hypothetical protein VK796_02785 [Cytophaga sp.]|nr:hypothetical protein [Cytophaga sp.]
MHFLFHTVILFDGVPAWYNISKSSDGYFAELVENPHAIVGAASFNFYVEKGIGKFSISLDEKQGQVLIEELKSR